MPRRSDETPINNKKLDRRIKLTEDDKELIRWLREEEKISQQKLADQFGVSKRLIQFVLNPEKQKKNFELRQKRGGTKQYYDKDKHRDYIRDHREYKKDLFNKGLIGNDSDREANQAKDLPD